MTSLAMTTRQALRNPFQPLQMLLLCSGTLMVIGTIMIASASMDMAAQTYGSPFYFVYRQLAYVAIGLVIALGVANLPIAWWQRSGWLLMGVAFASLILVLTPLGRSVNGSTRWIPMGLFNVQVSEIAKLCLIAYLAGYVDRRRDELLGSWQGFLKPFIILGAAATLLVVEPDFGATVVLMTSALGMIFLSGVRLTRFLPLIVACVAVGVALVVFQPYRLKRVVAYLDPWKDQFDTGYQLTQSLIAFGRGHWFGVGLGNSVQKLFYLPEAHTDFIFAIIGEEFGLVGALAVLAIYALLFWTGMRIGRNAERAGMLFAACFAYGVTLILGLQAFINMGVSTGLLPTKGLTLPLVSYGGSSLAASCVCIGILARVEIERLDLVSQEEGRRGR
ncbi:putative lipid II flippase FtsW [Mangrovitalea sediminis]|uniref:putative lipid II flippase FtsW n=1 Tax=Mangrovitalea sediminis TaxID=1982043 RepID=UPI000BE50877|nr:putative lipid II flippase FtsW [Mangrovitalea sediminis]